MNGYILSFIHSFQQVHECHGTHSRRTNTYCRSQSSQVHISLSIVNCQQDIKSNPLVNLGSFLNVNLMNSMELKVWFSTTVKTILRIRSSRIDNIYVLCVSWKMRVPLFHDPHDTLLCTALFEIIDSCFTRFSLYKFFSA